MEISTSHALKEWNIAIQALEAGDTIMLLRKGGIHEQGGRFQVAQEQVLLYPTYEHQQPSLLKPEYANRVVPVTSGWHPETVRIGSFALITHIFPVNGAHIVDQLLPFHIWNEHNIIERLKWKPRQPLFVLLFRAYKLARVEEIPYRDSYGGCKSWIDLEHSISIENLTPVLSESSYNQTVNEISNIIEGITTSAPLPQ
jgi:hypothetical protein